MRPVAHPFRLLPSLAALALAVQLGLVGFASPVVAGTGDLALTGVATTFPTDGVDGPPGAVAPVASGTTISLSSGITVFGLPVSARITVPGVTASGQVRVLVDGTVVASGEPAADGTVRVPLPATVAVGRHAVSAVYTGTGSTDTPVLSSSAAARALTVTRTLPRVRTDGTDWSLGRSDTKVIHVQVTGVAGVEPTGTVVVWVNGARKGTAHLDPAGEAVVPLATSTRTALVVVTYGGDQTFLPWVASPRLVAVR